TDSLGSGLTFGGVTKQGSFGVSGNVFTLPVGTVPGTYTIEYTATVNADAATGTVTNSVNAVGGGDPTDPNGPTVDSCAAGNCSTDHPVDKPVVTLSKSANPADGTAVKAGETLTFTVEVEVINSALLSDVVVTDSLGSGLTFGEVTEQGGFGVSGNEFTLPAGTVPGTYTIEYTATVNADAATGTVTNSVNAVGGGDPTDPNGPTVDSCAAGNCSTDHPVDKPVVTLSKSANPADGTAVKAGETLTFTVEVEVINSALLSDVVVTDSLGSGLTFGEVTEQGGFGVSGNEFTLPAGTVPGTYTIEYTATVNADAATGTVTNSVNAVGGGDPTDPNGPTVDSCAAGNCSTDHPVDKPVVTLSKSANPADGTAVKAGETLTFTVEVEVINSALLSDVVVTDSLGSGLTFGEVTEQGGFGVSGNEFTLPAGTVPGTYTIEYTATVNADAATGTVTNSVNAVGGGDPTDPNGPTVDSCAAGNCSTDHPVDKPVVTLSKSANPADGTAVKAGETLTFTVEVEVINSALLSDVVVTDSLGSGLTFGGVTKQGSFGVSGNVFTLPVGTVPGTYTIEYTATVNADAATGTVTNSVNAVGGGDPTDPNGPTVDSCAAGNCSTDHPVDKPVVTLSKSANPTDGTAVKAGETLTFTVEVEVINSALLSDRSEERRVGREWRAG